MWKVLKKEADLGEPTSFLDHVHLGCTQRECETSTDIVDNYRNMVDSKISAGATEKLPYSEKFDAMISSWYYDMESHAKKCAERYCDLANKTTQQLHRVATPRLDDHQFIVEELGSVGEVSKVCSQFSWNACIWRALKDLIFLMVYEQNLLVPSQSGPEPLTNVQHV